MPPRSPEHTFESRDSVGQYISEVGKYELLTAEKEIDLAQKMEEGKRAVATLEQLNGNGTDDEVEKLYCTIEEGLTARELFINSNLRLVISIAKREARKAKNIDLLDLIQEGNDGLITAVEKFDYRKGFKFSTYATWWIRQSITRGRNKTDRTIRLPVQVEDQLETVIGKRREFHARKGREPELAELVEETGLEEKAIKRALMVLGSTAAIVSSDTPLDRNKENSSSLIDMIGDDQIDVEKEAVGNVFTHNFDKLLNAYLNPRDSQIISLRFGLNGYEAQTLEAIGKRLGITRERVRQIQTEALATLREKIKEDELDIDIQM